MKKQAKNKLSLEKFQIAKINNSQSIIGGGDDGGPITPVNKLKRVTRKK